MSTLDRKKRRLSSHYTFSNEGCWTLGPQANDVRNISQNNLSSSGRTPQKSIVVKGNRGSIFKINLKLPSRRITLRRKNAIQTRANQLLNLRSGPKPHTSIKEIECIVADTKPLTNIVGAQSCTLMEYNYKESSVLTNIDGYVVTDGETIQVTLRADLNPSQKQKGVSTLLKYAETGQPAVYLWNANDNNDQ